MATGTRSWQAVIIAILTSSVWPVLALGTSCTAPLGPGTASQEEPYWLETISHRYVDTTFLKCKCLKWYSEWVRGLSAFNENHATYPVFRNVKSYGAVGDGITDDTDAIK